MALFSHIYKHIQSYRILNCDLNVNITSQQGPHCKAGKWFIPSNAYQKFIDIIADEITKYSKIQLHYLERPHKEYNQLKIDIDMRCNLTDEEINGITPIVRRYDNDFIEKFIYYLTNILSNIINFDKEHKVYIHEKLKPKSTKDHNLKDGIHIIIPSIVLPNTILHYIRNEIIKSRDIQSLLHNIGNITSIDEVIDHRIIEINSWFIYGCGKPEDNQDYYTVTAIYNISINISRQPCVNLINNECNSLKQYITLFSNYDKKLSCDIIISNDNLNFDKKNSKLSKADKNKLIDTVYSRRSCTMASKEILPLMNCIHAKRADNYNDWWSIGVALYNMDDRNFNIWDSWSNSSSKYDKEFCFELWYCKFPKCGKYALGLHTIKDYARRDNNDMFNNINNLMRNQFNHKWVLAHVREPHIDGISIDTFSNHVKIYINEYAKYKIVCADPTSHGVWYKFKNHMWRLDKASNEIYLTMAREIKEGFIDTRQYIINSREQYEHKIQDENKAKKIRNRNKNSNQDGSGNNDDYSEKEDSRVANEDFIQNKVISEEQKNINEFNLCSKKCFEIDSFLSNVINKDKVIKDLSQKCYDEEFLNNLNENRDVFTCKNGTLDLDKLMFRPGMPSDMSSISCKVEYSEEISYNEHELEIQDFLDKIFPDHDIQDYVINLISEKLSGRNRKEQFIICTGSASNGKSQFLKLLQNVFGEYYGTFDNSLLNTPKKDANSASPAIASLKGIRLAFTTEPKNGQPFETDKLKELIGGDELVGRHLRENIIRFIPQYLMGMMCNDIPEMPSTDDGVWRKVYVVPFESKFITKNEDMFKIDHPSYPYHFKAENKEHLYPIWAPYLLRILFERFKIISETNFHYPIPHRVREATRKYQMESNIYSQFFSECIQPRPGYKLTQNDIFLRFKDYTTTNNYSCKINKKTFMTQIERFIGKCIRNEFYDGYMLKIINTENIALTQNTEDSIAHNSNKPIISSDDEENKT